MTDINYPHITGTTTAARLEQVERYFVQLVQEINIQLDQIEREIIDVKQKEEK